MEGTQRFRHTVIHFNILHLIAKIRQRAHGFAAIFGGEARIFRGPGIIVVIQQNHLGFHNTRLTLTMALVGEASVPPRTR